MDKALPAFESDDELEAFLDPSKDLSDYLTPTNFEFARKEKSINLRISEQLLDAVRVQAKAQGMPYQRFIRRAIEQALGRKAS